MKLNEIKYIFKELTIHLHTHFQLWAWRVMPVATTNLASIQKKKKVLILTINTGLILIARPDWCIQKRLCSSVSFLGSRVTWPTTPKKSKKIWRKHQERLFGTCSARRDGQKSVEQTLKSLGYCIRRKYKKLINMFVYIPLSFYCSFS